MSKREMELLKRIEELEAKIKALEAAPKVEYHYHSHYGQYQQPYYGQQYYGQPYYITPQPYNPMSPWCSGAIGGVTYQAT